MLIFFGASDGIDEKELKGAKKLAKGAKDKDAGGLPKAQVQRIASANAYRMEDTNVQHLTFPKDYKYSDVAAASPVTPTLPTAVPEERGRRSSPTS